MGLNRSTSVTFIIHFSGISQPIWIGSGCVKMSLAFSDIKDDETIEYMMLGYIIGEGNGKQFWDFTFAMELIRRQS